MGIIIVLMALAVLISFSLSFYLCFFRLHLTTAWRWGASLCGGLISGLFMALLVLLIVWPPVLDFVTLGGLGIIVVTIGTVLTSGQDKESLEERADELVIIDKTLLLDGAGPSAGDEDR